MRLPSRTGAVTVRRLAPWLACLAWAGQPAHLPAHLPAAACVAPTRAIIPAPVSVTPLPGCFEVSAGTIIAAGRGADTVARQLADLLAPATGWRLRIADLDAARGARIELRLDASLDSLGPEGYRLDVGPNGVTMRAPAAAGLFYALQSFRQLLPAAIERRARVRGVRWTVPATRITDRPRFSWRGSHLDVARHFMPVEFVKKWLDLMALQKLNRFHWHLTDDQGWRLEVPGWPRLTEVGAWRRRTLRGPYTPDSTTWQWEDRRHGGFYTADDVREVVAYAAARHVVVVPEVDLPAHTTAAIAAYPALGTFGTATEPQAWWGLSQDVLVPDSASLAFATDVLAHVLTLFPSPWIHVGGDEVPMRYWAESPRVQRVKQALGLADEPALQSWFIGRLDAWLAARGRRMVGWDEILEGGLAPNATVMSWRGTSGGIAAAQTGHDVVMTPTSHTYFDYYQSRDRSAEPLAIGGFLPLDSVYAYEPVPAALSPGQASRVLGTQGQIWTEYIRTPKEAEYMAFPRLVALSEVAWSPASRRDWRDFRVRLGVQLARWRVLDVAFRRPVDP
ncbi:MAG: beta-N-acetylhexosaminidase [Gemmatimonadota bacterium]